MITDYEIKKTGELKPEKSYKTFDIGQLESTDFVKLLQMCEDPIITLIHHTDMDGICAAQIMKEYLINVLDIHYSRIKYLAYNYEKDYDLTAILLRIVNSSSLSTYLLNLKTLPILLIMILQIVESYFGSIITFLQYVKYMII